MSSLLFEFFSLHEMPHIETPTDAVVDLCVEKYPISQQEKRQLFQAFRTTGFVGKLSKVAGRPQFVFFSEKDGLRLATPTEEAQLPHLPDDWEKYLVTSRD